MQTPSFPKGMSFFCSFFLTYTRLNGDLEYLKTKTRLKDERFESVMGECVI